MGTETEKIEGENSRILCVDAQAMGLEELLEIKRTPFYYRFTHAANLAEATHLLGSEPFDAILCSYAGRYSEVTLRGLLGLKREDNFESFSTPPVIAIFDDEDHEGVARALSHPSLGFLFASQLRSNHAATILGAVMKRVSHDQLLEGAQQQLVNTEKFAAMGLLAAEVAHEINNPASFVISNLSVMTGYIQAIGEFLNQAREGVREEAPELFKKLSKLSQEYEISFLQEDLEELLRRNLHGMQRIHQIVQDLRFFLHDSHGEAGWINVERLLETTLNLVKYEAKYRTHFELEFCGDADILSDANRLSQVFLNVLVNAIHAIEPGDVKGNQVTVQTQREDEFLDVMIRDTGVGMSERVLEQIFEPFFTTKDRGEGSGLGLSISRDILQSLGGQISATSQVGGGSEFVIRLPVRAPKFERDARISGAYPSVAIEDASEPIDTDTPEDA